MAEGCTNHQPLPVVTGVQRHEDRGRTLGPEEKGHFERKASRNWVDLPPVDGPCHDSPAFVFSLNRCRSRHEEARCFPSLRHALRAP